MPERVAVHRIVVGTEQGRKVIEPGTRFNTDEYQISSEQLEKFDRTRVTREPRDQATEGDSPRARSRQGQVVEGRSGPARDVTNPRPGEEHARVLREPTDNRAMLPREGQPPRQEGQQATPVPENQGEGQSRRRRSDSDL